jgi:hypothetical protein
MIHAFLKALFPLVLIALLRYMAYIFIDQGREDLAMSAMYMMLVVCVWQIVTLFKQWNNIGNP